jgi:hypothetical protein
MRVDDSPGPCGAPNANINITGAFWRLRRDLIEGGEGFGTEIEIMSRRNSCGTRSRADAPSLRPTSIARRPSRWPSRELPRQDQRRGRLLDRRRKSRSWGERLFGRRWVMDLSIRRYIRNLESRSPDRNSSLDNDNALSYGPPDETCVPRLGIVKPVRLGSAGLKKNGEGKKDHDHEEFNRQHARREQSDK